MVDTARRTIIIGVGAVGCRLAAKVCEALPGHRCLFVDTDRYSLQAHSPGEIVLLEDQQTEGRGTGKRPDIARRAAQEAEAEIKQQIGEVDTAVIAASFGGGTGAGAGPIVARFARDLKATTIVAAVDPFAFESAAKAEQACEALLYAGNQAEAVVRIPCTLQPDENVRDTSFREALLAAERHAVEAAVALVQMVTTPGMLRLDFGDLRRVLREPGGAVIGVGRASGEKRVENAIRQACTSSLLDVYRIHAAANILLHVAGGEMLTAKEVEEGAKAIGGIAAQGDYLLSVDIRPELSDEVVATILLSGFSAGREELTVPAEQEGSIPEGAFVYEGVNVDTPAFLRRSRTNQPGRFSSGPLYR